MAQEPRPAGARPSRPLGRDTSFPLAPPSESHIGRAAIISLRPILRCRPARRMSGTVDGMRAPARADPPMSAWLPITRASAMCLMSVALSARGAELLVGSRKPRLRCEFGGPGSRGEALSRWWVWATWEDSWGDHRNAVVQGPPLPGRDHQPLRVAVLQVRAQLP